MEGSERSGGRGLGRGRIGRIMMDVYRGCNLCHDLLYAPEGVMIGKVCLNLGLEVGLDLGQTLPLTLAQTLGLNLGQTLGLSLGQALGLSFGLSLGLSLGLRILGLGLRQTLGLPLGLHLARWVRGRVEVGRQQRQGCTSHGSLQGDAVGLRF